MTDPRDAPTGSPPTGGDPVVVPPPLPPEPAPALVTGMPPAPAQYLPPGYYPPPPPGMVWRPLKPVMTVGGRPLADPLDRFVANLIDSLIIGAVTFIPLVGFMIYAIQRIGAEITSDPYAPPDMDPIFRIYLFLIAGVYLLQLVATYVYYVNIQVRTGQTVGKRVMKIQVVRQSDGGPIDVRMARKRWLTQFGGALMAGFTYANALWLLWDEPFRQCLHDKTAETVVVKVPAAVKVGL
jgi:uncharacterized RDD family membrane protein YckC